MKNILGLGSILLWQWLTVLEGSLFSSASRGAFPGPFVGYGFFCLVLCLAFFSLARWGSSLQETWMRWGMWVGGALMSLGWLPWGGWVREIPLLGIPLFLGLPALGSAWQLVCWEWRLSRCPFPLQALSFGLACAFRTFFIFLVPLGFPFSLQGTAVFLPFLGAFLWRLPGEASPDPSPQREGFPREGKITFPRKLALRVVAFFGVSAMFLSILLVRHSPSMALAQKLSDPFYSLGALGVGFLLHRFSGIALRTLYTWAQAFLGLGFLLFAALGERVPFLPLGLLQLGFGIFGAYIFTLLLYLGSRAGKRRTLSVVATGQCVVTGSVFLGLFLTKALGFFASLGGCPSFEPPAFWGWECFFSRGFSFGILRRALRVTT